MTRSFTACIGLICFALLLLADLQFTPPNAYAAPPIIALGSGQASAGGFCGALPQ
jgi:hypothetical protein